MAQVILVQGRVPACWAPIPYLCSVLQQYVSSTRCLLSPLCAHHCSASAFCALAGFAFCAHSCTLVAHDAHRLRLPWASHTLSKVRSSLEAKDHKAFVWPHTRPHGHELGVYPMNMNFRSNPHTRDFPCVLTTHGCCCSASQPPRARVYKFVARCVQSSYTVA